MAGLLRSFLVFSAVALSACGSPERKFCQQNAECDSDLDVAQCEDDLKAEYEAMEEIGCDADYDAYLKCLVDHGECVPDDTFFPAECDAASDAFVACLDASRGTTE